MDTAIATIPQNQAVVPIPEVNREVMPAYVWKTGRTFFLSKKEKIVADTFIATRSYAECSRVLEREGWKKNWLTCKRWIEKRHIQEYLRERFVEKGIANGWTKERWLAVMTKHLRGEERLANGDLYGMNLVAKVQGWDIPQSGGIINTINILQANGKA